MLSLKGKVAFRTAALTSAVGIVIIVMSQSHAVVSRLAKLTLQSAEVQSENAALDMRLFAERISKDLFTNMGSENPPDTANVRLNVEHPHSSFTDDSFFVRVSGLTFSVNSAPNDPDWNEASVRSLLDGGCLGLTLSVPGSEVSPSGVAPLRGGVAEWIVRPTHSGSYKALVEIVETPCLKGPFAVAKKQTGQEQSFEFINAKSSFSFDVTDRLLTREKLLSWIGGFFGAFLTLPGIIAFIESQREKRRKSREHEDKSRRIIV